MQGDEIVDEADRDVDADQLTAVHIGVDPQRRTGPARLGADLDDIERSTLGGAAVALDDDDVWVVAGNGGQPLLQVLIAPIVTTWIGESISGDVRRAHGPSIADWRSRWRRETMEHFPRRWLYCVP